MKKVQRTHLFSLCGERKLMSFTLIELLVVIAIIAILASILMPALSSARKRAKTTTCTNNLKTMMLGYQQYADDFGGIAPLVQCSAAGAGRYSFYLRVLKFQPNWKASFCPETDPIGYIGKRKFSDQNGESMHKVWRGVNQYSGVANWKENLAMDELAYGCNYKCHNYAAPLKSGSRNYEAQVRLIAGSEDNNMLNTKKVRIPGTFIVLGDGIRIDSAEGNRYRYVHGSSLYNTINTWGAVPFDIHRERAMNSGYLDGHVSLADEGELRRNFINGDYGFVPSTPTDYLK